MNGAFRLSLNFRASAALAKAKAVLTSWADGHHNACVRRFAPPLFLLLGGLLLLLARQAHADTPVPERLLNPRSPAEAWNVLRLAIDNSDRLVAEARADEVAGHIVMCSPALRLIASHGVAMEKKSVADEQVALAFSLINLIARESMAGNLTGVANALVRLRAACDLLSDLHATKWRQVEIFACPDHPENVAETPGQNCPQCQRPLAARRVPYSFVHVEQPDPVLRVEATADAPLQAGQKAQLTLHLKGAAGAPAKAQDLLVNHAALLHLLLVDEALEDFHHLVPRPGQSEGEFLADFTPARAGSYRLWVGVVPVATSLQEYHAIRLPGREKQEPAPESAEPPSTMVEKDGFRFHLSFHQAMQARAGRTQLLRIEVVDLATGEPVKRLEPFWNAFSHLTGVRTEDGTVFQLHPVGGDILREDLRGGPFLAYKYYPPKAGTIRLFCEVRIDGKRVVAPFTLKVAE